MVDPQCSARCAIRDTRAVGGERYHGISAEKQKRENVSNRLEDGSSLNFLSIGGRCSKVLGQFSPDPALGGSRRGTACYRVVSAMRKSFTMVARQTSAVLDRQSEHIADAAFGLNDPRRT